MRHLDLLTAAGLTLLAWVHRVCFLFSNRDRPWPLTVFYEGDSRTFFLHARALLGGELYDSGIPFHPPGFPYFLAGVHSLVGAGAEGAKVPHLGVKIVLAFVASLAVGLLYLLVRPYLGRAAALVAALACTYHFGLYVIAIAPVSEGLYLTLLMAGLLLWSRGLEHPLAAPRPEGDQPRPLAALALGVLFGLLALTRAEAVLPAALLWGVGMLGWWRQGRQRKALIPWLLVAAAFALTLVPWTLTNARNLRAANERLAGGLAEPLPTFVPLTLYGPLNLALANNPQADGSFSRDFMSSQTRSGQLDLTNPQHLEFFLHGDAMAWRYIREHPADWSGLVLRKWKIFFEASRLGWTQWNWPAGLTGFRRPVDVFLPESSPLPWVLLPLTVLGLILGLKEPGPRRRWTSTVLLLAAAALSTTAFFFGYARHGLLLMPFFFTVIAPLPVAGVRWMRSRWIEPLGSGWSRKLVPTAAILLVVSLLVLAIRGAGADRTYRATGTTLPGQSVLNPDLMVYLEPLPSS